MNNRKKLYENIPYHARKSLCQIFSIPINSDKIKKFISSNLPGEDSNLDDQKWKNYNLYYQIGNQLIAAYEISQQDKKKQEPQIFTTNYEQSRKKAMLLKLDQLIKVKDPMYCSGLGFFLLLSQLAREERYLINIPQTLLIGYIQETVILLYTNKSGILASDILSWDKLQSEIEKIHCLATNYEYPASVLKYESYNNAGIKIRSEILLYKIFEAQDVFWKIHNLSYGNNYIVLQEFVRSKPGYVSKVRVQYTNKIEKVYRIHCRQPAKWKKKEPEEKNQASEMINLVDNHGNIEKAVEICEFFLEAVDYLEDDQLETYIKAIDYFNRRKHKLFQRLENFKYFDSKGIIKHPTGLQVTQEDRLKLFKHFAAALSHNNPDVYTVANFLALDSILLAIKEIVKSSRIAMQKSLKIVEIVLDFVEDDKCNYYLIKTQKVVIEERNAGLLPKKAELRHISLFGATEGSSITKAKKQQLCCGDYCNVLKRYDFKTSEKIEILMKSLPEYSSALFQLLKIQNSLNVDSSQSLFNEGNRTRTPMTQNMQFKLIRRMILEDRNDHNSLRSIISTLPDEIIQEIAISRLKKARYIL